MKRLHLSLLILFVFFTCTFLHETGHAMAVFFLGQILTEFDDGLWEENLPARKHQLVLTSHQSPGTASVYLKTP